MTAPALELPEQILIYSREQIAELDPLKVPKHIAIIMDGNRRWAKQKGIPPTMGHWEGAEVLSDLLRAAAQIGVKTITVYAFSTENWGRSQDEIEDLMDLFHLYLTQKKEVMVRDGVKLDAIGDLSKLPAKVIHAFEETKKATSALQRINLVLALNYGGRDEIRRAVQKILAKRIPADQITEECIAEHLDTHLYGDPDLLIRTSGEMRMSNFLLWQISYTEFFSTPVLWPDFSKKELLEAVLVFQNRNRRLGG